MVALKGFKWCKRWSLRDLDHELANPWNCSSDLQKLHDDIHNQCAGRLPIQFFGFDSSPQQSGTSGRRKDRIFFSFAFWSSLMVKIWSNTLFWDIQRFMITTPSQPLPNWDSLLRHQSKTAGNLRRRSRLRSRTKIILRWNKTRVPTMKRVVTRKMKLKTCKCETSDTIWRPSVKIKP